MRPLKEMHHIFTSKKNKKSNTDTKPVEDGENLEEFETFDIDEEQTTEKQTKSEDKNIDKSVDAAIYKAMGTKDTTEKKLPSEDKEIRPTSRIKSLVIKDVRNKPVFLEDTGEKIGTVFDIILGGEKNLIGYKIKDNTSEAILSFSADQFYEDKNGLIFVPSWYTKGIKTIEELEFKDKISPELNWLLTDNTISEEELYDIFVKHDDEIANYMEKATALKTLLNNRLQVLERERIRLKEDLMDLTEKRLIKDIDRRKFSEIVMVHRRKVNVLDINIKKCKELKDRLASTSFGTLSNNIISNIKKDKQNYPAYLANISQKDKIPPNNEIEDTYKDKYYDVKKRYEELKEKYDELKEAVEKIVSKGNI
ncbi:MAG: hypothetical protein ACOC5T_10210 [Elusimicrobiota bacterium]